MTYVPHLQATSCDRNYLPDAYYHFGLGVHPHYRRSFSLPVNRRHDSPPVINDDGFEAHMDVYDFAPKELTVKTYETPRTVVIAGNHEVRKEIKGQADSDVERHFIRKLIIPADIDFHSINVSLTSDGILTVRGQKMNKWNERILPILQTGPAKLNVKHHI